MQPVTAAQAVESACAAHVVGAGVAVGFATHAATSVVAGILPPQAGPGDSAVPWHADTVLAAAAAACQLQPAGQPCSANHLHFAVVVAELSVAIQVASSACGPAASHVASVVPAASWRHCLVPVAVVPAQTGTVVSSGAWHDATTDAAW